MLKIYQTNTLTIDKVNEDGIYVDGGEEYGMISVIAAPDGLEEGDQIDAFLYFSTTENIIATMEQAKANIGECALLTVIATEKHGAFLDWGLPKDLFVPLSEQATTLRTGDKCMAYVYLDYNERPIASTKLHLHLDEDKGILKKGDAVSLMIAGKTVVGYKAIINNKQLGVIYETECAQPLKRGQHMRGWVKNIRPDGKIDLNINAMDEESRDGLQMEILEELQRSGGRLNISDKSSPEEIFTMFNVSKKNFKRAIGALYKDRKITLTKTYIETV